MTNQIYLKIQSTSETFSSFWQFFDGLLLGMPGLYFWRNLAKKETLNYSNKNVAGLGTNPLWWQWNLLNKKEGKGGTIQNFFYLILITVTHYIDG